MDLQLKGRACLVTGASAGIGIGIARTLSAEKARVAIVARRSERLNKVADDIEKETGLRPIVIVDDVTSTDGPRRIVEAAEDAMGRVEVLVNNAGASAPIGLETGPEIEAVWENSFALNFTAIRRLTEAVLPSMRTNQFGRVINVTGYMEPRHLNAAYSGKAATNVWAKGLSCVVAQEGVTINCIAPGLMRSEQIVEKLLVDEEIRQQFIDANVPFGRLGEPEDIGNLVAFLSSQNAHYITGALIPVDGGMHYFAG